VNKINNDNADADLAFLLWH